MDSVSNNTDLINIIQDFSEGDRITVFKNCVDWTFSKSANLRVFSDESPL